MEQTPNFQKAEMLARELRLMQPSNKFTLYPEELEFDRNITIDTFEHYSEVTACSISTITLDGEISDGYTVILDKDNANISYVILFHEKDKGSPRTLWTILHEIGHIYLGHKRDGKIEEIEAHWFAAEFLMPIPLISQLIKRINVITTDMLCSLFSVSENAGLKKISSMGRMYKWSDYLYDDFIEKYSVAIDEYVSEINIQIPS